MEYVDCLAFTLNKYVTEHNIINFFLAWKWYYVCGRLLLHSQTNAICHTPYKTIYILRDEFNMSPVFERPDIIDDVVHKQWHLFLVFVTGHKSKELMTMFSHHSFYDFAGNTILQDNNHKDTIKYQLCDKTEF